MDKVPTSVLPPQNIRLLSREKDMKIMLSTFYRYIPFYWNIIFDYYYLFIY